MKNSEPLVEFKNAAIGYGKTTVLRDVSLQIHAGEFLGILGHNGSGKTTLLKTLLGLIPLVKGELNFKKTRVSLSSGTNYYAPQFGYVPQKEKLDPIYPLTAGAVAALGTYRRFDPWWWLGRPAKKDIVRKSLKECGATDFAHKMYSELSGGQRQRILIARALTANPAMLILDEPLSGIDITTQHAILKLLKHLKDEKGLTILMVSHRVQAEKNLFTHIAWVDEGKVEVGPAQEMLSTGKVNQIFKAEL